MCTQVSYIRYLCLFDITCTMNTYEQKSYIFKRKYPSTCEKKNRKKFVNVRMCHALTLNASFDKEHGFRCIENGPHAKDQGMRSCGINIVNYVKICIPESKVLKYRDIAPRMKDSRPTDHKRFTRVVQNIRSRARRVLGFCNVSEKYSRRFLIAKQFA